MIDLPSNMKHHILVFTKYLTKFVEVKALKLENEELVEKFLAKEIVTRFGAPKELVTDRGT